MNAILSQDFGEDLSVTTSASRRIDNEATLQRFATELGIVIVGLRWFTVVVLPEVCKFVAKNAKNESFVSTEPIRVEGDVVFGPDLGARGQVCCVGVAKRGESQDWVAR